MVYGLPETAFFGLPVYFEYFCSEMSPKRTIPWNKATLTYSDTLVHFDTPAPFCFQKITWGEGGGGISYMLLFYLRQWRDGSEKSGLKEE